jgi:prepilin-type N-terminal cleavage/methylation domain-containing protein
MYAACVRRGFTVIELMVVIALVSLLASLAYRGLSGARESARRTSCQANVTQWRIGLTTYMDDYKGYLPFAVEAVNYPDDFKEPVNVLAAHMRMAEPVMLADGSIVVEAPWRCPSDPVVAFRTGTSYFYELRHLMDWQDTSRMDVIKTRLQSGQTLPVFVRDSMAFHHPRPTKDNAVGAGGRNVLKSDWSIEYVEP